MKFTYYTIIGKDINLLKGHVQNVKEYAGFDSLECDKEFIMIVYRNSRIPEHITNRIIEYCNSKNIRPVIYDEPTTSFIHNLYACWNLGYQESSDGYVFRAGSDQVFSKNSFVRLYQEAENFRTLNPNSKFVLQANTIENASRIRQIGATSRHFVLEIGTDFTNFDYGALESFITNINRNVPESLLTINDALRYWGRPTSLGTSLGQINRVDGCSWLMTKQDWLDYGPLPVLEGGISGDVLIHDRLQRAGYVEFMVRDCVTYHFVRGESITIQ